MLLAAGSNLRMTPEEYAKRLWDWTPLNAAFKRGIRVGDVDGFVEVNKHYLFIEAKPPNTKMPTGQRIAFERIAREPRHYVFVIYGYPPDTVVGWRVLGRKYYKGNYGDFVRFVRKWFEWAEKNSYA